MFGFADRIVRIKIAEHVWRKNLSVLFILLDQNSYMALFFMEKLLRDLVPRYDVLHGWNNLNSYIASKTTQTPATFSWTSKAC